MVSPREKIYEMIAQKRAERLASITEKIASEEPFVVGKCKFYPQAYVALYDDKPLRLTSTEFLIAMMLSSRPEWTYSRNEIADEIGMDEETNDRSIDSHVKRIRRQYSVASRKTFNPIKTVYGVGYRWNYDFQGQTQSAGGDGPSD